ncbi:MAG TPA: uroporphyrinogen decarboxylase [Parvularcula sp.]|nr:uroporphyrinogen decarboxylase [Parvularcula sp.]HBS32745.1 uroporphyrinogen decarboxylase [Parvularcula sp.]HBS35832.1 uroporphyrinogen decarboxylase [Parvularcula sp.]
MKPLLAAARGQEQKTPPIWLMRQAGRYLPEYRATRARAGSFLDLCYNSDLAAEVTLQPIRRYDFDAAILFADILLVPHALGQDVSFMEGEGPRLAPVKTLDDLERFRGRDIHAQLAPVYETVRLVRARLSPEKTLIGFAGAPWTVATYMIGGGAQRDPAALRKIWYDDPGFAAALTALLVDATAAYLIRQIEAGAEAVQLFDSWAAGLPEPILEAACLDPADAIARKVKAASPGTPVILFPKGVGASATAFAMLDSCDVIGIDHAHPFAHARRHLSPHATVQGGLDPMLVVAGGRRMEEEARRLRETFRGAPYIFNLGHGLTPDTPPENVARLVEIVRGA